MCLAVPLLNYNSWQEHIYKYFMTGSNKHVTTSWQAVIYTHVNTSWQAVTHVSTPWQSVIPNSMRFSTITMALALNTAICSQETGLMMCHLNKFGCKRICSSEDIVKQSYSDQVDLHWELDLEEHKTIPSLRAGPWRTQNNTFTESWTLKNTKQYLHWELDLEEHKTIPSLRAGPWRTQNNTFTESWTLKNTKQSFGWTV